MIDTVNGFIEVARLVNQQGWPVTFVSDWQTRGRGTLTPGGAVNHWTAGPRTGDHPSLGVVVNGRPGLRNALCNTYSSREPRLYVVAARTAWHAGRGSWRGLTGNGRVLGHEAENSGGGEWTDEHLALIADVDWAQCVVFGYSVDMVCDHFEWTDRKVDRNDVGGPPWRDRVRKLFDGGHPGPDPDPEDDMLYFWKGEAPDGHDGYWLAQFTLTDDGYAGRYRAVQPDELATWQERADNDPQVRKSDKQAAPSWFAGLKRV